MSHTVESCPRTKLNGGLSRLRSADEDAVRGMVHDTHTRKRRRWQKVMSEAGTSSGANARRPNAGIHLGLPD